MGERGLATGSPTWGTGRRDGGGKETKKKIKPLWHFMTLFSGSCAVYFCFILSTGHELLNPAQSQEEENYFPPLKRKTIQEFIDIFFNWT